MYLLRAKGFLRLSSNGIRLTYAFRPLVVRQRHYPTARLSHGSKKRGAVVPDHGFGNRNPRHPVGNTYNSALFSSHLDQMSADSAFLLDGLNDAQREAVTQPLDSITRVVAGPGAGKTKVLTTRIAYLLQNDPEHHVLAVTFTKKAAGEMQERLKKLVHQDSVVDSNEVDSRDDGPLGRATLSTFHSICSKILRWNGKLLQTLPSVLQEMAVLQSNLDGSYAIIDQSEQISTVKDVMEELELKDPDVKPLMVLSAISKIKGIKSEGKQLTKEDKKNPNLRLAEKLYSGYRQRLWINNSLDFDDLILLTRELLYNYLEVREALQKRFCHILVDEFQDTSTTQLEIVRLLTTRSLLVVGDADQSIYSWRGAHVRSMSDFCDVFKDFLGGVKTVWLMENYRSTTNIVNAAQKVISASSSAESAAALDTRRDMKPMRGVGATPRIVACADSKSEADLVVNTIQTMQADGKLTPDSSVAVIYRTNAQSRSIEEACVRENLPYVIRGASGAFYNRQEIKDCLCFLRWLHNGRDQSAMMRAVKTPSRGIGPKSLQEFLNFCEQLNAFYQENHPSEARPSPLDILLSLRDDPSAFQLVEDAPPMEEFVSKRVLRTFTPFADQMAKMRESALTGTVSDLIGTIIEVLDFKKHINSISRVDAEVEDRWNNVLELRSAAERFSEDGPALGKPNGEPSNEAGDIGEFDLEEMPPLQNFLDDVALVTDIGNDEDKEETENSRVLKANLMTVHSSKGMEFDLVFVIGVEEGTLPSHMASTETELEEEQRLCYVAMTRAKNNLILSWRKKVFSFMVTGKPREIKKERSRFLDVLVAKKKKGQRTEGGSGTNQGQGVRSTVGNGVPAQRTRRASSQSRSSYHSSPENRTRKPIDSTRREISTRAASTPYDRPRREQAATRTRTARTSTPRTQPRSSASATMARATTTGRQNPTSPNPDSTWLYPVGSSVLHNEMGEGTVLEPPTDNMKSVRVKFKDGSEVVWPAIEAELYMI